MSPAAFAETKAYLTDIKSGKIAPPKTDGHTYEVDINASPDEFINYDAPWADQPDVVKRHFSRLAKNGTGPDGSDLARRIESGVWLDEARNAGIKGIRYKDAGSRGGPEFKVNYGPGEGYGKFMTRADAEAALAQALADGKKATLEPLSTSNYVVFDENTINILKKYGIAGLTAGGAGAAMLGGGSQDASAATPSYSTGGRF